MRRQSREQGVVTIALLAPVIAGFVGGAVAVGATWALVSQTAPDPAPVSEPFVPYGDN